MDVIVYDPAGKSVCYIKIESFEELGLEVERLIKEGSVKANYYLEYQEYRWRILANEDEELFLEKLTSDPPPKTPVKPPLAPYRDGSIPEASKDQTEFNKSTAWSGFWYFLAAANMLIALVSLFAVVVHGNSLASAFIAPSIAGAIAALFFGWISEVANHIRWLLSEQLKELKRPQS
jgi:hypothetical protein